MEKLFIETKYKGKIEIAKELIKELPGKVMVASTVQFVEHLGEIKKKLEAYGKEVYLFNSRHGRYSGQILGCDNFKLGSYYPAEGFLYIGDGEFHPRALLINEKPVFCYNPFSGEVKRLGRKEIEEEKLRKKVGLMKFYAASKIGVIISVKEKQREMQGREEQIEKLIEGLEKEGKEVYLFLGDEIRKEELENFNFIEGWVNTACPRISDDVKEIVNLRELAEEKIKRKEEWVR